MRQSTENSPSPTLNGTFQVVSSQELAAQLHSGHLRAHSSHFSPYATQEGQNFPSYLGPSTINLDFPLSDIGIPITSQPRKSNSLNGDRRIVFENATDMVQYHIWFVNLVVKPAENDTRLETGLAKAASYLARLE